MALRLLITAGARKGEEYVVKGEVTLGRKRGDLKLFDHRSSSLHAKITLSEGGAFEIEDLGSSNGTLLNEKLLTKSPLKPGDVIKIGATTIEVHEFVQKYSQKGAEKGSWQETLDSALGKLLANTEKNPLSKKALQLFDRPFVLEFIQGLQAGTKSYVAFGPRDWGGHCPEGLLFESQAAPLVFRLLPRKGSLARFESLSPSVLINGKAVESKDLEIGDRISLGHTVIVIQNL